MSAQPAQPPHQDLPSPGHVLAALPEREHGNFLRAYRDAVDGARDPAGWEHLQRTLRLWNCSRLGFSSGKAASTASSVASGVLIT